MSNRDESKRETDEMSSDLRSVSPSSYHDSKLHAEHTFEQYKLYVQMTDTHANRFDSINKFFLSVNLAMISGLLLLMKENIDIGVLGNISLVIVTSMISLVWWSSLRSSKKLTSTRYEVIEELEGLLPVKPFYYEWHAKLEGGKKYQAIQRTVQWIPWFVIGLYIILGIILVGRSG